MPRCHAPLFPLPLRYTIPALALLLAGLLPEAALAQQQGRQSYYQIRVFEDQDVCRYQIVDYADQDAFRIEPYGVVDFQAEGTNARVEVRNSGDDTPGTAGDRDLRLRDGGPPLNLRARGPLQRSTEHKVYIRCCASTSLGRCTDAREAQPLPASTGMLEGAPRRATSQVAVHGAGTATWDALVWASRRFAWPWPAGGPMMRVEEDE